MFNCFRLFSRRFSWNKNTFSPFDERAVKINFFFHSFMSPRFGNRKKTWLTSSSVARKCFNCLQTRNGEKEGGGRKNNYSQEKSFPFIALENWRIMSRTYRALKLISHPCSREIGCDISFHHWYKSILSWLCPFSHSIYFYISKAHSSISRVRLSRSINNLSAIDFTMRPYFSCQNFMREIFSH